MDFGSPAQKDNTQTYIIIAVVALALYWYYKKNNNILGMEFFEQQNGQQQYSCGHNHQYTGQHMSEEQAVANLPTAMEVPHYASWQD